MLVLLVMLSMMSITWVCDHWQYFGCMSVLAMMATGIFRAVEWISRGRPFLRPVLGGILLLSLGLLTRLQCGIYADSETIWEKTIVRNPDSWLVQYNLGVAMAARRKLDGAVEHYERALELKPDYADGHNSLGILLAVRGESDAAILHYERALQLKPDFAKAHSNLGVALGSQGKWDAAIPHFKKALALKPDHVTACHYLGKALAAQGKHDEAVQYFRQALDLAEAQHNPALAETIRNQLQLYEAGLPTP